jgi:hypothetical protein
MSNGNLSNGNGSSDDPAPHPLDLHVQDLETTLQRISTATLDGARQVRDAIDVAMKAFTARGDLVRREIESFDQLGRAVVDTSKIMAEAMSTLTDQLKIQLPKPAPRVDVPELPPITGPFTERDMPRKFGRKGADSRAEEN